MIKTVSFDVYGTLAGFQPSRYKIQSKACTSFGIKVTPEGIRKGYAMADSYMSKQSSIRPLRLRNIQDRDKLFAEYEQLVLLGSNVRVTKDRALEIFRCLSKTPYKLAPYNDVVPTLIRLKAKKLTLGLISNMNHDGNELTASLGLTNYLDFTVTSGEVNSEKPAPTIFKAALRKSNSTPTELVHVGDQIVSDVEGALALGIKPILLDRDCNHIGFERCPRIESLSELPDLLLKTPYCENPG